MTWRQCPIWNRTRKFIAKIMTCLLKCEMFYLTLLSWGMCVINFFFLFVLIYQMTYACANWVRYACDGRLGGLRRLFGICYSINARYRYGTITSFMCIGLVTHLVNESSNDIFILNNFYIITWFYPFSTSRKWIVRYLPKNIVRCILLVLHL